VGVDGDLSAHPDSLDFERTCNTGDGLNMTHDEFTGLVIERTSKLRDLLTKKGKEYAKDADRLIQFKDGVKVNGCKTPEKVLWGMVTKQIMAVRDFINALEAGEEIPMEWWEEKLPDIGNYMLLLEGLVIDRKRAASDVEPYPHQS
jgi:hypothetical protein